MGGAGSELDGRPSVLNPHLHDGVPLAVAARRAGVPRRTATRWLAAYQANGLDGLRRLDRTDRGGRRLPAEMSTARSVSRWWPVGSPHPFAEISAGVVRGVLLPVVSGVSHPVGLAIGDDDGGVVQEPVQDAGRGGVFGQEPAPLIERPVRGNGQAAALVGGGDEPEQQLGAGVESGAKPNLVDLCGCPHRSTYADTATMPRRVGTGW